MTTPRDMPPAVQDMLDRRSKGKADPAIPRYLQRVLVDQDVLTRSAADGIFSPEVAVVETHVVQTGSGAFRVRLFAPSKTRGLPLVLHLHGGAFVLGSIDWPDVDARCRQMCLDVECAVVTVDYRLAPERPFPQQIEDCYAALLWCVDNAHLLGIDPGRIVVWGESAGANLAAVTALMARDRGGPKLAAQVLEIPYLDLLTLDTQASFARYAKGFGLEAEASINANMPLYCDEHERGLAYVSPLHAHSLANLPPALIMTAEFDILKDSGKLYARRLAAEGNQVTEYDGAGHNHGSPSLFQTWQPAAEWFGAVVGFVRTAFGVDRCDLGANTGPRLIPHDQRRSGGAMCGSATISRTSGEGKSTVSENGSALPVPRLVCTGRADRGTFDVEF